MSAWGWSCFDDMFDTEWSAASQKRRRCIFFPCGLIFAQNSGRSDTKVYGSCNQGRNKKIKKKVERHISPASVKRNQEQVLFKLKKHFLPVPGEFNVVWSIANNEIWFASTQTKIIDLFYGAIPQDIQSSS